MKKIKNQIRVAELDRVSDVIIQMFHQEAELTNDAYLNSIMSQIETLSAQITTAIKSDKIVSKLDETDSQRDEVLKSIGALLKGAAVSRNAEKKAAAEQLVTIFEKYKGIVRESYAEESSHIESLLEDFAKNASLVAKLDDLQGYLDDLRAAEDEFNRVNVAYLNANAGKGVSASAIKKPLLSLINDKLVPYLSTMSAVNAGLYGHFTTIVEQEIDKENATVNRRAQ